MVKQLILCLSFVSLSSQSFALSFDDTSARNDKQIEAGAVIGNGFLLTSVGMGALIYALILHYDLPMQPIDEIALALRSHMTEYELGRLKKARTIKEALCWVSGAFLTLIGTGVFIGGINMAQAQR